KERRERRKGKGKACAYRPTLSMTLVDWPPTFAGYLTLFWFSNFFLLQMLLSVPLDLAA
ncbi:hypothetical protein BT69DRAFT_1285645, partial [Atractiella rhizophila]